MNFSSFEKTWDDSQVYEFLISHKYKHTIGQESAAQSIAKSAIATTTTSIILTTAMIGASSQVWGLINGL